MAFAAAQDRMLGRGMWIRLFSGRLTPRMSITLPAGADPLTGEERFVQPKVTQIRSISGAPADALSAGEVGVVFGLSGLSVGQVIGERALLPRPVESGRLRTPLITVQVVPEDAQQMQALREACDILSAEDPLLQALNQGRLGWPVTDVKITSSIRTRWISSSPRRWAFRMACAAAAAHCWSRFWKSSSCFRRNASAG